MLLVAAFLLSLFAFLGWLAYVAYRDPAGIFRPRPRDGDQPGGDNPRGPDTRA
jgi:hypothetical protein